jgi:Signal peptidase (SPase) II
MRDMGSVRARRTAAAAAAGAAAAADLGHKALAGSALHHLRSPAALLLMALVAAGLLLLVPRIPSIWIALGAGVAAGGALGNLVSALVWRAGVPDPIVVRGANGGIAFNLADVFVLAGIVLETVASLRLAIRYRHLLPQNPVAVRIVRKFRRPPVSTGRQPDFREAR